MDELLCTCAQDHCFIRSWIMPAGGRGGGRRGAGGRTGSSVQQATCSYTGIRVGLLNRPVDGRATECSSGRPTVTCQPGFKLNCLQGRQPLHASACILVSRIDNKDPKTRTRISFDNQLFSFRFTFIVCVYVDKWNVKRADTDVEGFQQHSTLC